MCGPRRTLPPLDIWLLADQFHINFVEWIDIGLDKTNTDRVTGGYGKSMGDIAAELTFSEPTHFTRFFAQHVGLPPAEFRRRTTIVSSAMQR